MLLSGWPCWATWWATLPLPLSERLSPDATRAVSEYLPQWGVLAGVDEDAKDIAEVKAADIGVDTAVVESVSSGCFVAAS